MDADQPAATAHGEWRPLRVRSQNMLIDRWRVSLPGDPEYPGYFAEAMLKVARSGRALQCASAKQVATELRRRAISSRLRRLGDPAAGPRSLRGVHGWGEAVSMIATSWWMYRWSALLTDTWIALTVSLAYVLLLYVLLRAVTKHGSVLVLGAWLFVFWIAVCCVLSYRAAPQVVSSTEADHWLRTELPPHASTVVVLHFIARHKNTNQSISYDTIGNEHWITASYQNQGGWVGCCPPDVAIEFELSKAGRLVSMDVSEQPTCS